MNNFDKQTLAILNHCFAEHEHESNKLLSDQDSVYMSHLEHLVMTHTPALLEQIKHDDKKAKEHAILMECEYHLPCGVSVKLENAACIQWDEFGGHRVRQFTFRITKHDDIHNMDDFEAQLAEFVNRKYAPIEHSTSAYDCTGLYYGGEAKVTPVSGYGMYGLYMVHCAYVQDV